MPSLVDQICKEAARRVFEDLKFKGKKFIKENGKIYTVVKKRGDKITVVNDSGLHETEMPFEGYFTEFYKPLKED